MKKIYQILILILILCLVVFSCKKDKNINTNTDPEPEEKEWTFLLYDDADFDNAGDPLLSFKDHMSSNDDINYLVLRDGEFRDAAYYFIDELHNADSVLSVGEVNMGAKATLKNFLNYAKQNYPAKRYILAFYNHGGGWSGCCYDKSAQDMLTNNEMSEAIAETGGIDLMLFTAPCNLGSVEAIYQMRNVADYYLGSAEASGYIFWYDVMPQIDQYLKTHVTVQSRELASKIIELIDQTNTDPQIRNLMTMSAMDLSKANDLVLSFNAVTDYYILNMNKFIDLPKDNLKRYYGENYIDLKDLLLDLLNQETDQTAIDLLNDAIQQFDECIVVECHGDPHFDSHGLNIFYPDTTYNSEIYYSPLGIGLDFKDDCSWDELLKGYLNFY